MRDDGVSEEQARQSAVQVFGYLLPYIESIEGSVLPFIIREEVDSTRLEMPG